MASMARPGMVISDRAPNVSTFIEDLRIQRVRVLFSLDNELSFEMHTRGVTKDSYLKQQLKRLCRIKVSSGNMLFFSMLPEHASDTKSF